jgi:esterase/lipase superfamily enzyme
VCEALRQLKLTRRTDVLSRLEVVLAAPDIDADVMRQELEVIGRLSPPLTILVSKDDRALKVASFISGSSVRVGALDVNDPRVREAAVKHGVLIVDTSEQPASNALNHDKLFSLAALYRSVATGSRTPTLGRAGAFILDTAGATVSSPFRIMSGVLDPVNAASP